MVARMEKFRYKEALRHIGANEATELTPGMFLRFTLAQQWHPHKDERLTTRWLSDRCGYKTNLIQTHFSQGGALSADLCYKLAAMTDLPVTFWSRERFDSDEAAYVFYHDRDVSHQHAPHARAPRDQWDLPFSPETPTPDARLYTRPADEPMLPMDERFIATPPRRLTARQFTAQERARRNDTTLAQRS